MSLEVDAMALGEVLRRISRDFADLADLVTGNLRGSDDMTSRQMAALREFPAVPAEGLSRGESAAVFRRHGLDSRSIGVFVKLGYLRREGDRRWLTAKGREFAQS